MPIVNVPAGNGLVILKTTNCNEKIDVAVAGNPPVIFNVRDVEEYVQVRIAVLFHQKSLIINKMYR
jgi:hypothetical protein